jgi:uncharacterized protein (TIGR03435 family)
VPTKGGLKIVAMKEGECIPMDSPDAPHEPVLPPAPMPQVCGAWGRRIVSRGTILIKRIDVVGLPMSQLVDLLSAELGRPVIDRTGFTQKFSVSLDFDSGQLSTDFGAAARDPQASGGSLSAPLLGDALKERLGLELKTGRGPVEVLQIERIERPSEN